jgi:hypothetical protein
MTGTLDVMSGKLRDAAQRTTTTEAQESVLRLGTVNASFARAP